MEARLRILAVAPGPNFSVADVHDGWVAAFKELGIETADFNLDRRLDFYCQHLPPEEAVRMTANSLHAACYQYRPDVVFITSCMFLPAVCLQTIRAHGTRIVILHTESPYEDDLQIQRAAAASINLVNDPAHLDMFRSVAPSWYVPQAYRPDRHYPHKSQIAQHRSDFCFVGTGFPSRVDFLERVDWSGVDVALGGHWANLDDSSPLVKFLVHDRGECLPNAQTAQLYAGTRMSANFYRKEANQPELAFGWAMSPREIELAAMGVFFLREPRPEGDQVLSMLPTFGPDPEDFSEQLHWWLDHEEEMEELTKQAREAISERTFLNHAKCLMRILSP